MTNTFSSIEGPELGNVYGGQQPPAAVPAPSTLSLGAKAAKKIVPVLKVVDAADGAITDYDKARAAGDGRLSAVGSGGLGALNRATFGLSDWVIGR